MKPNGRGVNGYRPYRRYSVDERMAAVKYDLDRLAERAKAREAAKASEPHVVSEPEKAAVLGDMIYARAKYAVASIRGIEPRIVYADSIDHAKFIYQRGVGLIAGDPVKMANKEQKS